MRVATFNINNINKRLDNLSPGTASGDPNRPGTFSRARELTSYLEETTCHQRLFTYSAIALA